MRKKAIGKISALLILISIAVSFCLPVCAAENPAAAYEGKKIGVLTGSIHDEIVKEYYPGANECFFANVSDMVTALLSGAIDYFSCDLLTANALVAENDKLIYNDDRLASIPTAYAFSKDDDGAALCAEMDEFINSLEADGTLKKLQDKWLSAGAADYVTDMSGLDGKNGTLTFTTGCTGKPNSYYYENSPTDYEIELAVMFCRKYGYNIDIQVTDFAGIIPGLVSHKYQFAADGIAVTGERKESVRFSVPDYQSAIVMMAKKSGPSNVKYTKVSDLNKTGIKLGIVTGMAFESCYEEYTPLAELKYFNSSADMIYSLTAGQIDGFVMDAPAAKYIASHTGGLAVIDETVEPVYDFGFAVGNTDFDLKLRDELNEYIAEIKSDGTLDEMYQLWFGENEENAFVDYPAEGENGTVRIATNAQVPPIVYVKNGKIEGLELDIIARFCKKYGYVPDVTDMDFSAILSSVEAGRCDIAANFLTIMPERLESMNFTEPYISAGSLMVVRETTEKTGFLQNLHDSFERTFIREQRWKLIVQGIYTTLIISIGAVILGTLLGFGLCLLRRIDSKAIKAITTVYIRIMQGTPVLVILMILYYIIFAKAKLPGELVAITAFALNFAAYSSEIFRTGIESVDRGQTEAALSIGFTKARTFFGIVLPQAAESFLPVYKGEFISLVKTTSIVGYIAVQDLTKMSDIIRSRTYEAFFPLIATAVIYFLLSSILTGLLKFVDIKIRPNRKNRKIKGVVMK